MGKNGKAKLREREEKAAQRQRERTQQQPETLMDITEYYDAYRENPSKSNLKRIEDSVDTLLRASAKIFLDLPRILTNIETSKAPEAQYKILETAIYTTQQAFKKKFPEDKNQTQFADLLLRHFKEKNLTYLLKYLATQERFSTAFFFATLGLDSTRPTEQGVTGWHYVFAPLIKELGTPLQTFEEQASPPIDEKDAEECAERAGQLVRCLETIPPEKIHSYVDAVTAVTRTEIMRKTCAYKETPADKNRRAYLEKLFTLKDTTPLLAARIAFTRLQLALLENPLNREATRAHVEEFAKILQENGLSFSPPHLYEAGLPCAEHFRLVHINAELAEATEILKPLFATRAESKTQVSLSVSSSITANLLSFADEIERMCQSIQNRISPHATVSDEDLNAQIQSFVKWEPILEALYPLMTPLEHLHFCAETARFEAARYQFHHWKMATTQQSVCKRPDPIWFKEAPQLFKYFDTEIASLAALPPEEQENKKRQLAYITQTFLNSCEGYDIASQEANYCMSTMAQKALIAARPQNQPQSPIEIMHYCFALLLESTDRALIESTLQKITATARIHVVDLCATPAKLVPALLFAVKRSPLSLAEQTERTTEILSALQTGIGSEHKFLTLAFLLNPKDDAQEETQIHIIAKAAPHIVECFEAQDVRIDLPDAKGGTAVTYRMLAAERELSATIQIAKAETDPDTLTQLDRTLTEQLDRYTPYTEITESSLAKEALEQTIERAWLALLDIAGKRTLHKPAEEQESLKENAAPHYQKVGANIAAMMERYAGPEHPLARRKMRTIQQEWSALPTRHPHLYETPSTQEAKQKEEKIRPPSHTPQELAGELLSLERDLCWETTWLVSNNPDENTARANSYTAHASHIRNFLAHYNFAGITPDHLNILVAAPLRAQKILLPHRTNIHISEILENAKIYKDHILAAIKSQCPPAHQFKPTENVLIQYALLLKDLSTQINQLPTYANLPMTEVHNEIKKERRDTKQALIQETTQEKQRKKDTHAAMKNIVTTLVEDAAHQSESRRLEAKETHAAMQTIVTTLVTRAIESAEEKKPEKADATTQTTTTASNLTADKKKLTHAQEKIRILQEKIRAQQTQLDAYTATETKLTQRVAGLVNTLETKRTELERATGENTALKTEITTLKSELLTTEQALEQSENARKILETRITETQREKETLRKELTSLKNKLRTARAQRKGTQTELESERETTAKQAAENQTLRDQLQAMQEELTRTKAELEAAQAKAKSEEDKATQKEEENKKLKEELETRPTSSNDAHKRQHASRAAYLRGVLDGTRAAAPLPHFQ